VSDEKGAVVAMDKATGASVWKQDKLSARHLTAPLVRGNNIAVADFQGYLHLLSREDGSFSARLATDGNAVRSQPVALDDGLLIQTSSGGLYAISIK
jgi:outer membrane protein assembly factor BamB